MINYTVEIPTGVLLVCLILLALVIAVITAIVISKFIERRMKGD